MRGNGADAPLIDRLFVRYLRAPEHPMKGRIERLLLRAARKQTLRCTDDSGIRYEASPWECVQSNIIRNGSYEPGTLALARTLLRPGSVMVDVGANIGEFSLVAASVVGAEGRVIAIEASPVIYETLRRNVALNGFANVHPVLVAAGASEGLATFGELPAHNWGMNRRGPGDVSHSITVASRTVDSILRDCGVDQCDLLKIDVEGMEMEVLGGVDFTGPRRPRNIIVEYITELQTSATGDASLLAARLRSQGYELMDINGLPLTSAPLAESNLWARDRNL
jgi:FkbM family methyltransferase